MHEFPSLNGKERDYVFSVCERYGLQLEYEAFRNSNKKLVAVKVNQFHLDLQVEAKEILHHLAQQPLQPSHHNHLPQRILTESDEQHFSPLPVIPPLVLRTKLEHQQLPAWQHKDKIVDVISNNQVQIALH